MARPRPPPLYRLARAFRIASVLVVVLIIAYLAFVAYSVFQLTPSDVQGVNSVDPSLNGTQASLAMNIEIHNPGYAPVNQVAVNATVQLENHTPLANARLPSVSIGPSDSGRLPFALNVSFANQGPAEGLLFNSTTLWLFVHVNVTYAYIFTAHVGVWARVAWGAPFANLSVSAGVPAANPNGTVTEPISLGFTNQARFTVAGNLSATVRSSSGVDCGTVLFPINVPGGSPFQQTEELTGEPSCLASGATVQPTWVVGPHLTIVFPPRELA